MIKLTGLSWITTYYTHSTYASISDVDVCGPEAIKRIVADLIREISLYRNFL
jgi:hypothetical protein